MQERTVAELVRELREMPGVGRHRGRLRVRSRRAVPRARRALPPDDPVRRAGARAGVARSPAQRALGDEQRAALAAYGVPPDVLAGRARDACSISRRAGGTPLHVAVRPSSCRAARSCARPRRRRADGAHVDGERRVGGAGQPEVRRHARRAARGAFGEDGGGSATTSRRTANRVTARHSRARRSAARSSRSATRSSAPRRADQRRRAS